MGTTIAAALLARDQLSFAHVGDSRIYLIRSGSIEQLTSDHSFVQEQLGRERITKEEASQSLFKNVLTRALGVDEEVAADLGELTVLADDILLLCSDGLYNMLSDEEMLEIILRAGNVRAASEILTDIANDNGGGDNISAVVGHIRKKKWYRP
jgi:protein phosphatase